MNFLNFILYTQKILKEVYTYKMNEKREGQYVKAFT